MSRTVIITRTVDRPALLERALRAILAQTDEDWEWLLVTPDPAAAGVPPLLEKHAAALRGRARVLKFQQSAPGMRGQPLNHAIARSDSEFITVLDDDDTWSPTFLSSLTALLESPAGRAAGGAVCLTQVVEETPVAEGSRPLREYALNPHLRSLTLAQLSVVNQFCVHAFLYRREALPVTGLYPEDFPVLEDWHFNLRFLRCFDIAVLPETLTFYHQRPGAATTGAEANSLHAELDLHKFYEAKLINDQLRQEWETGRPGLGALLAAGTRVRLLEERIHRLESKLKTVSEKTGKIDSRTKEMKDTLLKGR